MHIPQIIGMLKAFALSLLITSVTAGAAMQFKPESLQTMGLLASAAELVGLN